MSEHLAYLNVGSNINPERNLPSGVALLRERVELLAWSTAWESRAVGDSGPNFLNACVLLASAHDAEGLKSAVIQPVEAALGRVRGGDKFAARTIDLDIILLDEIPLRLENWKNSYLVVPLAELLPEFPHPLTHEPMAAAAERLRRSQWIEPRADVLTLQRFVRPTA